jgi:D-amino-acid oxidase
MRKFFAQTVIALWIALPLLADSVPEVVHLTPPIINGDNIQKKIACTRPMRQNKFNISIQNHDLKTIVHCYGHGGYGWTTLFGTVNHAIELFEATSPSKKTPIRVLGSGCIGLTVAAELTRLGYYVEGVYAKSIYDTPSWNAGGSFSGSLGKILPEEKKRHSQYKIESFLAYQKIELGEHPYLTKETVRFLPSYTRIGVSAGLEDLEAAGLIPAPKLVTLDFGNGVIHTNYREYHTYFMDVTLLMQQLLAEVQRNHIPIEIKEVFSFDEIEESVIFNCTGLGSKELLQDELLQPYRGHLIMLSEKAGTAHMDYMIDSAILQNGVDQDVYMFPKNRIVSSDNVLGTPSAGVLGGTFISVKKMSKEDLDKLDEKEFQSILDRCSLFFSGHKFQ